MKRTALLALTLTVGCNSTSVDLIADDGTRVTIETEPFVLRIFDTNGVEKLATFPEGEAPYGAPSITEDRYMVGERLIPGWDGYEANEQPWRNASKVYIQKASHARAEVLLIGDGFDTTLDIQVSRQRVRISQKTNFLAPKSRRFLKSSMAFALGPQERFFGLGERYTSVNHRGLSMYSYAEEAGVGQGEDAPAGAENPFPNGRSMTYYPVPFLLSSNGYGLLIDTTFRSEVHLGSEREDAWRLAVGSNAFAVTVYLYDRPLDTLDAFTAETGRPMIPASWVFGPRRRVSPNQMIDGVQEWKLLRANKVPTTGIDDAVHLLPNNSHRGREEELMEWTQTLHDNGFKVMAYNNPYVSETIEESAEDFEEGRENGYFVKDSLGEPGLTVLVSGELQSLASIDFTNADAVAWYQGLLKRTLDLGYDGWMHDFGEYVKRDWVFSDGRLGDEVHNIYPVMSAKAAHELLTRERGNDFLIFVRSGYTGTQAFTPAVWGGDPEASFDETQGIPASLRGGLNLAMSGVPYWGSDVAGFKCFNDAPRDKEMYLRWAQLGAVSPIMQEQNACVAAIERREKWTLWEDEETIQGYAAMARLHTRLEPYFSALAVEAHRRGTPLMRHPFLVFPQDEDAQLIEDAFFLGPSLYASPVVRRGQTTKSGYLPEGRYVDLTDFVVYEGGQTVDIPARLEKLPLLLVENQMVPMLDPTVETLATATSTSVVTAESVADVLDVVVALGPNGEAMFELADGTKLKAARHEKRKSTELTQTSSTALSDCALCVVREGLNQRVNRIQVNGAQETPSVITVDEVTVTANLGPDRRIRWDVLLVD